MELQIQHLRELERAVVKDLQNANNLIEIKAVSISSTPIISPADLNFVLKRRSAMTRNTRISELLGFIV
jgi:transcriptional regulator CtsR